jgi:hypothetical protein
MSRVNGRSVHRNRVARAILSRMKKFLLPSFLRFLRFARVEVVQNFAVCRPTRTSTTVIGCIITYRYVPVQKFARKLNLRIIVIVTSKVFLPNIKHLWMQ